MDTQKRIIHWQPLNAIPGLIFRYFAGEADHQIRCDIANALKEANSMDWVITVEDIRNDEKWTTNYDIHQQLIYVELEETVIGYMGYNWQADISGEMIFYIFGNLLSEYWGKGIADLMLQYVEEKIHEVAVTMPTEQAKAIRMWRKQGAREYVASCRHTATRLSAISLKCCAPSINHCPMYHFRLA